MVQFFLNGGLPMVFVLALGLAALVGAFRFATAPDGRRVGAVAALSLATFFSALVGLATAIAVAAHAIATTEEYSKDGQLPLSILQGISEAMSPVILGGVLLCVTWMVMAVGYRRMVARLPA